MTEFNPEYNFYEMLSTEMGMPVSAAPQPNTPATVVGLSNIVPGPNGTVMNGGAMQSNNYVNGIAGWLFGADGIIRAVGVILSGSITSTAGTIGGWTINATTLTGGNATLGSTGVLTLGTTNDVVIASAADATYRLWIGNATAASAPFRVTKAGAVTATEAVISGNLTAESLTLGGLLKLKSYLTADLPDITADVGANDATVGTIDWLNPANAIAYSGLLATAKGSAGSPAVSQYLKITDFDYAVPSTATILGIQVEIEKSLRAGTSAVDSTVKLVKADGTFGSENKANAVAWGSSRVDIYGGPNDLWGETWTPTDVNDIDFGAALSISYNSNVADTLGPGVAVIRVVVFYTGQTDPVGIGSLAFATDATNLNGATGTIVFNDGRTWRTLPAGLTSSSFLDDGNDVAVDATPDTDHYQSGAYTGGSSNSGFTAGASIAAMDLICLDASSTWQLTDANASATAADVFLGVSRGAYSAAQQVIAIMPQSFVRDDTWNWTPGAPIYISETAGQITQTAPNTSGAIIRKIGYAVTADVIYFDPSTEYSIAP